MHKLPGHAYPRGERRGSGRGMEESESILPFPLETAQRDRNRNC
jgi:hypothetical protein